MLWQLSGKQNTAPKTTQSEILIKNMGQGNTGSNSKHLASRDDFKEIEELKTNG